MRPRTSFIAMYSRPSGNRPSSWTGMIPGCWSWPPIWASSTNRRTISGWSRCSSRITLTARSRPRSTSRPWKIAPIPPRASSPIKLVADGCPERSGISGEPGRTSRAASGASRRWIASDGPDRAVPDRRGGRRRERRGLPVRGSRGHPIDAPEPNPSRQIGRQGGAEPEQTERAEPGRRCGRQAGTAIGADSRRRSSPDPPPSGSVPGLVGIRDASPTSWLGSRRRTLHRRCRISALQGGEEARISSSTWASSPTVAAISSRKQQAVSASEAVDGDTDVPLGRPQPAAISA